MTSLQREGFVADTVGRAVRRSLLNPRLTGTIATVLFLWDFLSSSSPSSSTKKSLPAVPSIPSWLAAPSAARSRLWKLFLAGVAFEANAWLNRWSHNNWTAPAPGEWTTAESWADEIVLVTGGSSGIGASMARRFLRRNKGTRVVIVDYAPLGWEWREEEGDDDHNDSEAKGDGARPSRLSYYQCDLNSSPAIKSVMSRIRSEVGHPTVLINNAGLVRGYTVMEGDYADVESTVRVNLTAPLLLMKEVLPEMVRRDHGHIVGLSSMSSQMPPAKLADYAATKAGLIAAHEAVQLELCRFHSAPRVRMSHAVLGFVRTPMVRGETGQSRFVFPMLHPETVSEALVEQVCSGFGGVVFLPGAMRYISMARGGPEWWLRVLRNGTNKIAVDIRGRQKLDVNTGLLSATEGNEIRK